MLEEVLARLHSTMGGLSDTELKLLAVRPTSLPSTPLVVTIVTPVAKDPSAFRNTFGSSIVAAGLASSRVPALACAIPIDSITCCSLLRIGAVQITWAACSRFVPQNGLTMSSTRTALSGWHHWASQQHSRVVLLRKRTCRSELSPPLSRAGRQLRLRADRNPPRFRRKQHHVLRA